MTSNLENLISRAASIENTPELQKYWERRYREAQEKNRFQVNDKTLELINATQEIKKPATAYADILLLSHFNQQKELQENVLQDTIEIVVRLLDAVLDAVNFGSEPRKVVAQYRKIAIGVGDFDDYVSEQKLPRNELINYIGNFVSSKAYRASESLAEEKGSCQAWKKIKQQLRPKSFEFWYNRSSGEIRSGQELSQEFNQTSILESNFEIIPRRNSSLLLYPQTDEWLTWSDRDRDILGIATDLDQDKDVAEVPPKIHTDNHKKAKHTDPIFQLGELVRVQKPSHPKNQEILQVVDVEKVEGAFEYRLSDGQKETENELWSEADLAMVELSELLERVNRLKKNNSQQKSDGVEAWVRAVVLDEKDQILVEQTDQFFNLPGVVLEQNQIPEKTLQSCLVSHYNFVGDISQEIGSAVSLRSDDAESGSLNLGFVVDMEGLDLSRNVLWLPVNSPKLPDYAKILLVKLQRQREKLADLENRLSLAISDQRKIEEALQNYPDKQKIAAKYTSETSHREYQPEVLAKTLGSLSKYVLKLEQMVESKAYGEMLLTLTYDAYGPRIVNLEGKEMPFELKQTLDLFLDLINFILTNNINSHFLSERLVFRERESIQLPIKQLLQFIGGSLELAPERVQEIDSSLIEEIDGQNLNKIKKRDTLKPDLKNAK